MVFCISYPLLWIMCYAQHSFLVQSMITWRRSHVWWICIEEQNDHMDLIIIAIPKIPVSCRSIMLHFIGSQIWIRMLIWSPTILMLYFYWVYLPPAWTCTSHSCNKAFTVAAYRILTYLPYIPHGHGYTLVSDGANCLGSWAHWTAELPSLLLLTSM